MRSALAALLLFLTGCASVSTEGVRIQGGAADEVVPGADVRAHSGPRHRVQVIRVGVGRDIAEQHPELADRRVGYGLSNRILEALYETGRFDFVEEKDSVLKKMSDQWRLSEAGIISEDTRTEPGSLTGAEFIVYAEVFDFSVTRAERLAAGASTQRNSTLVGVQIRLVDATTGEYVVASGSGDATTTASALWVSPTVEFDQSTVGIATRRAVNLAVNQLLSRALSRGVLR
jgi:curli biogenesis system outer membrane secretion channel CsgG